MGICTSNALFTPAFSGMQSGFTKAM